jgi:hypothetical protein
MMLRSKIPLEAVEEKFIRKKVSGQKTTNTTPAISDCG